MAKLTFNTDLCKGCGLCVDACPKHCLAISTDTRNIQEIATPLTSVTGSR